MLRYSFLYVSFLIVSAACAPKETNQTATNDLDKKDKNSEKATTKQTDWRNPILTPMGADLARMLRAYYLVGDINKMLPFLILPSNMDAQEFSKKLRASDWGYELRVTNVMWEEDSAFTLSIKTQKQQTVGVEFYRGTIQNDTAKLFIFPENKNPFLAD